MGELKITFSREGAHFFIFGYDRDDPFIFYGKLSVVMLLTWSKFWHSSKQMTLIGSQLWNKSVFYTCWSKYQWVIYIGSIFECFSVILEWTWLRKGSKILTVPKQNRILIQQFQFSSFQGVPRSHFSLSTRVFIGWVWVIIK